MHDFADKTQIAHTFTLFTPLGGICVERASHNVGLLGGELVDRCVFLSKVGNETHTKHINCEGQIPAVQVNVSLL